MRADHRIVVVGVTLRTEQRIRTLDDILALLKESRAADIACHDQMTGCAWIARKPDCGSPPLRPAESQKGLGQEGISPKSPAAGAFC